MITVPESVYATAVVSIYVGYQLTRLAVYWFVIIMGRPQPRWLDVKRLVRR